MVRCPEPTTLSMIELMAAKLNEPAGRPMDSPTVESTASNVAVQPLVPVTPCAPSNVAASILTMLDASYSARTTVSWPSYMYTTALVNRRQKARCVILHILNLGATDPGAETLNCKPDRRHVPSHSTGMHS